MSVRLRDVGVQAYLRPPDRDDELELLDELLRDEEPLLREEELLPDERELPTLGELPLLRELPALLPRDEEPLEELPLREPLLVLGEDEPLLHPDELYVPLERCELPLLRAAEPLRDEEDEDAEPEPRLAILFRPLWVCAWFRELMLGARLDAVAF